MTGEDRQSRRMTNRRDRAEKRPARRLGGWAADKKESGRKVNTRLRSGTTGGATLTRAAPQLVSFVCSRSSAPRGHAGSVRARTSDERMAASRRENGRVSRMSWVSVAGGGGCGGSLNDEQLGANVRRDRGAEESRDPWQAGTSGRWRSTDEERPHDSCCALSRCRAPPRVV